MLIQSNLKNPTTARYEKNTSVYITNNADQSVNGNHNLKNTLGKMLR